MIYAALIALAGWLFYDPYVALGLVLLCGLISIFYAIRTTEMTTDRAVIQTFAISVLIMSGIALGVVSKQVVDDERQKYCNAVVC